MVNETIARAVQRAVEDSRSEVETFSVINYFYLKVFVYKTGRMNLSPQIY